MSIDLVKIRAKISIGNLVVETPYIQSFNVRKSRGQLSSFDASLKVEYTEVENNISGAVVIEAGTDSGMNKIYTGILKKTTVSPCWDDPGYIILKISGTDILDNLKDKQYSRRCRATKSTWVSIDSVVRRGLRDSKFEADMDSLKLDGGNLYEYYAKKMDQEKTSKGTANKSGEPNPIQVRVTLDSTDST